MNANALYIPYGKTLDEARSLSLIQVIRSLNADGVKYYNPSIYRFLGEWILFKCNHSSGESLAFKQRESKSVKHLPVDHKKIKIDTRHFYNVTNLTNHDTGEYVCYMSTGVIGQVHGEEIKGQHLVVLKKGKTCINGLQLYF